ncbi:MAG: hypothetical protein AAF614_36670 [Chloroflexota bacterium]
MFHNTQTQIVQWVALGLLMLTLAFSALALSINGTADIFPILETSSVQVEADAVLACEGGGGSNNESGIC